MSVWLPYCGCYALRQTDLSFSSQFKSSSMYKAIKTQAAYVTKSNTEYQWKLDAYFKHNASLNISISEKFYHTAIFSSLTFL